MLNIQDMPKKDKFFMFMEGLKSWTCTKLQRHGVVDLSMEMGAIEWLMNYQPESRKDQPLGNSQSIREGNRPFKTDLNSNRGERYSYNKGDDIQGLHQSNF